MNSSLPVTKSSCTTPSAVFTLEAVAIAAAMLSGWCVAAPARCSAQAAFTTVTETVTRPLLPSGNVPQADLMTAELFPAATIAPIEDGISTSAPLAASLPDSPDVAFSKAQAGQPEASASGETQSGVPSKRVLGIVPNYRSVGVGAKLPPQTVRQKFGTALSDTIDPASFVLSALVATYDYGRGATPEFGSGGVAFGRYYWHALADQQIENVAVEFLVPALTHEDTRYYTLGKGGARKRIEYSLSRIVVTRSDSGKATLNLGELLGAGLASGISSRYYPSSQRDAGSVLSSYGLNLGIDAASFVLREFDSDLARTFSRKKHD